MASPLRVFVTDPDGENKTANNDTNSTDTSIQMSPPLTNRQTPNCLKSSLKSDSNHVKDSSLANNYACNTRFALEPISLIKESTTPESNDSIPLHPRLARFLCLPGPDKPSDACFDLYKAHFQNAQHHSQLVMNVQPATPNHRVPSTQSTNKDLRRSLSEKLRSSNGTQNRIEAYFSKKFANRILTRDPENKLLQDSNFELSRSKLSEMELLALLTSIIATRKSQIQHQTRKKRLLQRLADEAYGHESRSRQTKNKLGREGSNSAGRSDVSIGANQTSDTDKKVSSKSKNIRDWFTKKQNNSIKAQTPDQGRKASILSSAKFNIRRLSNVSINKSAKPSFDTKDLTNYGHIEEPPKLANTRSDSAGGSFRKKGGSVLTTRIMEISGGSNQQLSNFLTALQLKEFDKQNSKITTSSESISLSNPTTNLTKEPKPTQTTRSNSKKRNSSCGHCSCSSGSRSEPNSPGADEPKLRRRKRPPMIRLDTTGSVSVSELTEPRSPMQAVNNLSTPNYSEEESCSSDTESVTSVSLSTPTESTSLSSTSSSDPKRQAMVEQSNHVTSTAEFKPNQIDQPASMSSSSPRNYVRRLSRYSLSVLQVNRDKQADKKIAKSALKSDKANLSPKHRDSCSERDMWFASLQWVKGPKVNYTTSEEIIRVFSSKCQTKALAEYNKNRLTCVFVDEDHDTWEMKQFIRLAGCQMIPNKLDISAHKRHSVNNRSPNPGFENCLVLPLDWEISQSRIKAQPSSSRNNSFPGYTLKPALLRMPNINRFHRHFQRPPKSDSSFPISNPNSRRTRSIYCVCCYDPLDWGLEHEKLINLSNELKAVKWMKDPIIEGRTFLPWTVSIQVSNIPTYFQTTPNLETSNLPFQFESSNREFRKLPRRYHRAASSARQNRPKVSSATCSPNINRDRAKFGHARSSSSSTQLNQSEESLAKDKIHANLASSINSTSVGFDKSQIVSGIFIEAHLQSVSNTDKINTEDRGVTSDERQLRISSNECPPPIQIYPTDSTLNFKSQTKSGRSLTYQDIHANLLKPSESCFDFGNKQDRFGTQLTMNRSNSEFHFDPKDLHKFTLPKLYVPESISIQLVATHHNFQSTQDKVIASNLIQIKSPIDRTLTGYQHFKLNLSENLADQVGSNLIKDEQHEKFHAQLRNTIGLLLFCKLNVDPYVPKSLGDLFDTLSREYSFRHHSPMSSEQDKLKANQKINVGFSDRPKPADQDTYSPTPTQPIFRDKIYSISGDFFKRSSVDSFSHK